MRPRLTIGIYPNCLTEVLGGTERLCHGLILYLLDKGHEIILYCNNSYEKRTVLPLPHCVKIKYINLENPHNNDLQNQKKEFEYQKINVFLSFSSNFHQLFFASSLIGTHIPYIYSELVAPEYIKKIWNDVGRISAMSGADIIHMLHNEYVRSLPTHLQQRVKIIPSPAPTMDEHHRVNTDKKVLISLGAQNKNKQIDCLIKAFEQVAPEFPDWLLEIWGVGPDANILSKMARRSSANEQIRYQGFAQDALQTLARASLYCIPSAYEGMPLTLLEAMSLGLPAVGFAGCPGVNHIIRHGENGLLATSMSPDSLAEQLARLMADEAARKSMGSQAREDTRAYAPERIFKQWEDLLYDAATMRGYTELDRFAHEPFASQATLSAAARREYILRDFGKPMPGTLAFYRHKVANICRNIGNKLQGECCAPFPLPSAPPLPGLAGQPEVAPHYRNFRIRHTQLIRSILQHRREKVAKYEECGLPGEHMANGWHHSMLARYIYASHLFGTGGHICDLGAGFGWGGALLAQDARLVVCVERNPACIQAASTFWPNIPLDWRSEDIMTFLEATPDSTFDGITCMEVVEHFEPLEVKNILSLCARCLKDGGVAVFSSTFIELSQQSSFNKLCDNPFHSHIYSTEEIIKMSREFFSDKKFLLPFLFIARK